MEYKTLTTEDLKKEYSDRHGFVFVGRIPSDKISCDKVSAAIKHRGYTTEDVEFVVEVNPATFIFVYPEGCAFDSPGFYSAARMIGQLMGMWQVDTLASFLKSC